MAFDHMAQAQGNSLAGHGSRQAQVISELTHLQQAVASLSGLVDGLEKRLVGVMRGPEPMPGNAAKQVTEILVPVADQIKASRHELNQLVSAVDSIIRRLEI